MPFHWIDFPYVLEMMREIFCCAGYPTGTTAFPEVGEEIGGNVVAGENMMVITDRCHDQLAIKMIKERSGLLWTEETFCVLHAIKIDGDDMKAAEVIEMSQISNNDTAIVCKDRSFVDTMKALKSCAGALKFNLLFDARSRIFTATQ